ncbi:MAG: hypothetical protein SNG49_00210 [Rikenellaceae bacterium]
MKKNYLMLAAAFALCVGVTMTSCSEESNENETPVDETTFTVADGEFLPAEVIGTVTIASGASVLLDGGLHVKDGGVLVIEPGVTITAQYDVANTDYIFVEQGGMIEADGGDAEGVIVMTSTKEELGAWGGLHICGYAPINSGSDSLSEIESLPYGGSNADDNSGTLRYVRLEYTGYSYSEEQECNGVSFYGVGAGTTVEYVQAYHGSDDGFEFFGGTVNIKYCVVTSCSDDSFDWTDGWCGKAQFIVAYQQPVSEIGFDCDCLLECDNNGNDNVATPASHPVIANATLVGNSSSSKGDGVMLKAGTEIELYNSLITCKTNTLYIKTTNTDAQLAAGVSILSGNYFSSDMTNSSDAKSFTTDMLIASNAIDYVSALTENYVGTVAGAVDFAGDDFFTVVDYAGAVVEGDDWTAGWVK